MQDVTGRWALFVQVDVLGDLGFLAPILRLSLVSVPASSPAWTQQSLAPPTRTARSLAQRQLDQVMAEWDGPAAIVGTYDASTGVLR
jgi:hypothetical protein